MIESASRLPEYQPDTPSHQVETVHNADSKVEEVITTAVTETPPEEKKAAASGVKAEKSESADDTSSLHTSDLSSDSDKD